MAKQFNFSNIDELKNYAETMNTTIPENISKILSREKFNDNYKIYGESYNDFINIGTFYMNSYVKDSMSLDNADYEYIDFGKEFKDYMIKYYDQGLTNNEIKNLLTKIMEYNKNVIEKVRKTPILYLFSTNNGPYDFLSALLNKIKDELKEKYKGDALKLQKLDEYFTLFNRAEYHVLTKILDSFYDFKVGVGLDSNNEHFSNITGEKGFLKTVYETKPIKGAKLEKTESYKSVKVEGKEILAYDKDGNRIDFRKVYDYTYLYNKTSDKEDIVRAIDSITTYGIEDTKEADIGDKELICDETKQPITYTDSNNIKHYFCKTVSINKFKDTAETESEIEKDITELLSNKTYSLFIRRYMDAKINSMKILYEIEESKAAITKLVASYEEANKVYKYDLVTPFNLMAVSLTEQETEEWRDIINNDDDFRPRITYLEVPNTSQIVNKFDIGIIYKELNPNYRDALLSDYVDYMLGVLSCYNYLTVTVSSNSTVIINPDLDKVLRDMKINNNFFLLYDKEVLKRVINLYTNNYLARKSSELDIIRFFADSQSLDQDLTFIGYGSKSVDKDEIYSFLDIYNSVRHYYFTRLLNKSFINDTYYTSFEKFFLGLVAIEKFLSSRISNLRNVDKFTDEDVHNFLLSYGLKSIDESAVFSNQIEYKKDIIKNYNTLMKSKGSLNCLNKLYEIFTSRTDGLNLSRYYLVNDYDTGKMTFIPCSYSNDNLTKELFANLEKGRDYGELVDKDEYWDKVALTEDFLKEKQVDVIPTKYNLLDLIEDIRSKYITTQYLTSLIQIIKDTLRKSDSAGQIGHIFEYHFKIENDDALGAKNIELNEYLNILLDLFNVYNRYYYDKFKQSLTEADYCDEFGQKLKLQYYGFNLEGIDNLIGNKYLEKKVFRCFDKEYNIFSLKENFFKEISMTNTEVNGLSSAELLQNYIIGLNLLYLLQQTKDETTEQGGETDNSKVLAEYCKTIDAANSTNFEISNASLSNMIFRNILSFPIDYLNDLQVPENGKFIDDDFMEFTNALFENVYKTESAPYVISVNEEGKIKISEGTASVIKSQLPNINIVLIESQLPDTDTTVMDNYVDLSTVKEYIDDIMNIIIKMSDTITNILNMDGKFFNLGLSADSSNLLQFLVESFKIFFSYTSELSETANIWEYDSVSEYCSPYDYVKSEARYSLVDTNQYDEELIIIKQQGGSSNG